MDKNNFEKDIDVPSKRRIMDDYNAKDCEQCSPDSVCCYCKNIACYNLEEQLKKEKHSHEHTKVWIGEYIKKHPYRKEEYEQLKAELKSSKELRNYTYDCCKRAGEELAKNSFDWDGKEKNLVVQAIELNERFNQLKAENNELKKCYKNNSALLDFEETNTTKIVNKVMKLEKTLTEIKEIATHCMKQDICTTCDNSDKCHIEDEEIPTYDVCKLILQKISECEGNDD